MVLCGRVGVTKESPGKAIGEGAASPGAEEDPNILKVLVPGRDHRDRETGSRCSGMEPAGA